LPLKFWGAVQRRGGRVNIPEIGSRVGETCFGGIQRFYAELRREYFWGNLDLMFFGGLGGFPRGGVRRGGNNGVVLGEFKFGLLSFKCAWVGQLVRGFLRASSGARGLYQGSLTCQTGPAGCWGGSRVIGSSGSGL
jgi:hypothetical protein